MTNTFTDQDRELWRKAIKSPIEITQDHRRRILGYIDAETQVANAFKVSGLTPEQLEDKALNDPEALTKAEYDLIVRGYHIWDQDEVMADIDKRLALSSNDKMARIKAGIALTTPYKRVVEQAIYPRTEFFAAERRNSEAAVTAKVAENLDKPCLWIQRLISSGYTVEGKQP